MWHKAEWMRHLVRLKLSLESLQVELTNQDTSRGTKSLFIYLFINVRL